MSETDILKFAGNDNKPPESNALNVKAQKWQEPFGEEEYYLFWRPDRRRRAAYGFVQNYFGCQWSESAAFGIYR